MLRKAGILLACGVVFLAAGCGDDDDSTTSGGTASAAESTGDLQLEGTTWTGHRERIASTEGYRDGDATLTVETQEGLTIEGSMEWTTPEGPIEEPLVAAFTPGGDLMRGADEDGTYTFELVDSETLDYCYAEDGKEYRTTCARLEKQ